MNQRREAGPAPRDSVWPCATRIDIGEVRNVEIHEVVVQLDRRSDRFVAQAVLKREGFADAKIVLRVGGHAPTAEVEVRIAELFRGVERKAEKKIGEIVAGGKTGENEAAARIGIGLRYSIECGEARRRTSWCA